MLRSTLIMMILWIFQLAFVSARINIVYKDIECTDIDEEYFSMIDAYLTEANAVTANVTIIKHLPTDAIMHAILLGNSMGEYVIPSVIDIDMNLCEMLDEPIILAPLLSVLGFTASDCPPTPGVYGSEDYVVPEDNFPEEFPANEYMLKFELTHGDRTLLIIKILLDVQS